MRKRRKVWYCSGKSLDRGRLSSNSINNFIGVSSNDGWHLYPSIFFLFSPSLPLLYSPLPTDRCMKIKSRARKQSRPNRVKNPSLLSSHFLTGQCDERVCKMRRRALHHDRRYWRGKPQRVKRRERWQIAIFQPFQSLQTGRTRTIGERRDCRYGQLFISQSHFFFKISIRFSHKNKTSTVNYFQ